MKNTNILNTRGQGRTGISVAKEPAFCNSACFRRWSCAEDPLAELMGLLRTPVIASEAIS